MPQITPSPKGTLRVVIEIPLKSTSPYAVSAMVVKVNERIRLMRSWVLVSSMVVYPEVPDDPTT